MKKEKITSKTWKFRILERQWSLCNSYFQSISELITRMERRKKGQLLLGINNLQNPMSVSTGSRWITLRQVEFVFSVKYEKRTCVIRFICSKILNAQCILEIWNFDLHGTLQQIYVVENRGRYPMGNDFSRDSNLLFTFSPTSTFASALTWNDVFYRARNEWKLSHACHCTN